MEEAEKNQEAFRVVRCSMNKLMKNASWEGWDRRLLETQLTGVLMT